MAELVIALDYPTAPQALEMAQKLRGTGVWAKVGMELFTAEGPSIIRDLKALDLKVFLDLKFKDIPNTVKGAVRSGVAAGADMLNVHATGGTRMMQAAVEGLKESTSEDHNPILLAVTVLTSMDESDLPLAPGQTIGDLVVDLARQTRDAGLNGVVCSGHEAAAIKKACGDGFLCLTPGIRIAEGGDDQRRVMTPERAVAAGSDYLVVGRPVTQAENPAQAVRDILEQMG